MDDPQIVSNETVYRGRLFSIEVTELVMPNGVTTRREGLIHPGAVAMVPIDGEGRLLLVTQYRHAARKRLLEIPAGTLEPGEPPLQAAIRELQEEVGMFPGRIDAIGGIYVAPGYTSEYMHLFVCDQLRPSKLDGDHDEDIEVERLTPAEALAAIEDGRICDAKSVCGILRWMRISNR